MMQRRFPPPCTIEDIGSCFVVRDHSGQQLAYVYFEDERGLRSVAKLLTKDEARRIAVNVARTPSDVGRAMRHAFRSRLVGILNDE